MAKLPTPQRLVSAPGRARIVEPRGDLARARVIGQAGEIAQNLSDTIFDVAAKDAKRRAGEAADGLLFDRDPNGKVIAPDVLVNDDGNFIPSIYDDEYKRQVQTRFEQELDIDTRQSLSNLAIENPNNTADYLDAVEDYRQSVVASLPPQLRGSADTLISRISVQHFNGIAAVEAKEENDRARAVDQQSRSIYMNDLDGLIDADADDTALHNHREGYLRNLTAVKHLYTPEQLFQMERIYDRRQALGKVTKLINDNGPATLEGLALQEQIQQEILSGKQEVNIPGLGAVRFDALFGVDERQKLAQTVGVMMTNNAQMREHRRTLREHTASMALLKTNLDAIASGDKTSMVDAASFLEQFIDDPALYARMAGLVRGQNMLVDQAQGEFMQRITGTMAIDNFKLMFDAMPEQGKQILLAGASEEDFFATLSMLNSDEPENAVLAMRALNQRLTIASNLTKQPEHVRQFANDFRKYNKQRLDHFNSVQDISNPIFMRQQEAAGAAIKFEHSKKNRVMMLDLLGAEEVDYQDTSPQGQAAARQMIARTSEVGFVADGLTQMLQSAIVNPQPGDGSERLLTALDYFNVANSDHIMASRLSKQLGPNAYAAYSHLSQFGSFGITNNALLLDDVQEILKNGDLSAVRTGQQTKEVNAMFASPTNKAAKDLPTVVREHIFGDYSGFSQNLPMTRKMRNEYKSMWLNSVGMFDDDEKRHGWIISQLDDKYTQSKLAWEPERGAITGRGIGTALNQYVQIDDAPENYYPDPGAMERFEDRMVEYAQSSTTLKDADFKLIPGVNLFVERNRFIEGEGGPSWRLVAFTSEGVPIYPEPAGERASAAPVFNFENDYRIFLEDQEVDYIDRRQGRDEMERLLDNLPITEQRREFR